VPLQQQSLCINAAGLPTTCRNINAAIAVCTFATRGEPELLQALIDAYGAQHVLLCADGLRGWSRPMMQIAPGIRKQILANKLNC
jgi:hypothetical protein